MKVTICAVGKLRKGPELDLITDYLDRFGKAGRSFGLGPATILEIEDKRNLGMEAEAVLLERAIPAGSVLSSAYCTARASSTTYLVCPPVSASRPSSRLSARIRPWMLIMHRYSGRGAFARSASGNGPPRHGDCG